MKQFIEKGCVYVNGVVLSPDAIQVIDSLQTGGSVNWDNWDGRQFNNEGVNEQLEKVSKLENHFRELMIEDDDEIQESVKMLRILSDIRWVIESLRLPG